MLNGFLKHAYEDYELYLWLSTDYYDIDLWKYCGSHKFLVKTYGTDDYEDALHLFALQMNELEMYK